MTTQAIFNIGEEFNNTSFRLCEIDGVKHKSILDIITAFGNEGCQARVIWKRMKDNPDNVYRYSMHYFPGEKSATPVADEETLLQIICKLDSPKAEPVRLAIAQSLLAIWNPMEEFISELKERRLVQNSDKETWLYVCARLPDSCLRKDLYNAKELTLETIKMGITNWLGEHNTDNGYMMFSFQCFHNTEAEIVEGIIKENFYDFSVFDSHGYCSSVRLANALEMSDYIADDYVNYIKLAEKLFVYMVQVVKRCWPKKYLTNFGFKYNVVENVIPCGSLSSIGVELSYPCQEISRALASQMGMPEYEIVSVVRDPNIPTLPPVLIGMPSVVPSAVPVDANVPEQPAAKVDRRSKGIVISRDLITGAEVEYGSCENAANSCGITPSALRRTFVDFPSQLQGKHWRQKGMPYWVPPEGFVFDPAHYEKSHGKAVRATKGSEVRVFESRVAAAKIMQCSKTRTLSDYIGTSKEFMGFVWTDVQVAEYGSWKTTGDEPTSDATEPTAVTLEDAGVNGRCNGKIIARDLATGVEVIYDSATRAGAFNNICKHALDLTFVDKPRQVRGKHFRSFTATRYWSPPPYFKFDTSSFERKTNGYVVSVDEGGNIIGMYESVKAAAQLEDIKLWKVQQYINSDKVCHGRLWRSATTEEYDVWQGIE